MRSEAENHAEELDPLSVDVDGITDEEETEFEPEEIDIEGDLKGDDDSEEPSEHAALV